MTFAYATTLLATILAASSALAQERTKLNLQLQAWLSTAQPGGTVDLFLEGQADAVTRSVLRIHGLPKFATAGWVSATVPVDAVRSLDLDPAVRSISFSLAEGRALNDSMRVKAHVNEAHLGLAPLPAAYQGEGVLVGIIDTGLDFRHPDFKDSSGNTRVLRYWDQNLPVDPTLTPAEFGYGQAWDSAAINVGNCPANDVVGYGHGTTVGGTAAGNGSGNGHCTGVAPKADLIVVANDMDRPNWTASIVDAVKYITDIATGLGRPVAINISLGDYYGSHDGLDPAALMIDQMLAEEPGRVLVCAGGNSGALPPYHLRHEPGTDTLFSWFDHKSNSVLGVGAMYFDLWADTADLRQLHYSVGADKIGAVPVFRGAIPYRQVAGTIGQVVKDTLFSLSGNKLGVVHTYAEVRGGQVHMEVYIPQPDSTDQYHYRFSSTGPGRFDAWSSDLFGTSKIVTAIPDVATFPAIARYVLPDSSMSIVDSWACSPNVITVANYNNELHYVDMSGVPRDYPGSEGDLSATSSHGPTRTGTMKPDIASPGDVTFSAGPMAILEAYYNIGVDKLIDSLHMRNGGTSIASPSVAGTAALLLEKCPRATHLMVRDALHASAFADGYTGSLPNTRFGYGKLNTFDALVHTNFSVPLIGELSICSGDSGKLFGPDFMFDYAWSTGTHAMSEWVHGGDTIQLTVHDPAGCIGISDTVTIAEIPLPMATISVEGMELTSTDASTYQWYFEGEAIPGANGQTWAATANGHYFVHVRDSSGCYANSDTVLVLTVDIGERDGTELSAWPVPVVDRLHIQGLPSATGPWAYAIVDVNGRTVQQGWIDTDARPVITVAELPGGAYLLRCPAVQRSIRFIKQ